MSDTAGAARSPGDSAATGVGGFIDADALAALADEPFGWHAKGFPLDGRYRSPADVRAARPRVPWDGFATPIGVLSDAAIQHNVESMASFCAEHGVTFAPHGKTTMAPQLYERQLAAGAWGITLATPWQLRVARAFGVDRLLLANELTDPAAMRWLGTELARDPGLQVRCYVDDADQVAALAGVLGETGGSLDVLIEAGIDGGRGGVRTHDEALAVAHAVRAHPALRLVGVAAYEGTVGGDASPEVLAGVRELMDRMRRVASDADARGLFDGTDPVVLTAGGSAFFDEVVHGLRGSLDTGRAVDVVLRSGAYVSHDDLRYERVSPFSRGVGGAGLQPAITVWSRVLSRPEPGRAVIDAGRRDVPDDAGTPVVRAVVPADDGARRSGEGVAVTRLNDQHGYVDVPASDPLAPGDVLALGISHPCTLFDKWTWMPLVDADDRAIDVIRTFF